MHRSTARRDSSWWCSASWIDGAAGRGAAGRGTAGGGSAGRGGAAVRMPRTGAVAVGRCQTAEGTVVITVMRMVGLKRFEFPA